jgi:hypothetical protein
MKRLFSVLSVLLSLPLRAHAQVFNGPGLQDGINSAGQIDGPINASLRVVVLTFLHKVLGFVGLAAVIVIIIAGIYLIISMGEDEQRDKAKKIIQYAIIGMLIIFFARALVGFFLYGLPAYF